MPNIDPHSIGKTYERFRSFGVVCTDRNTLPWVDDITRLAAGQKDAFKRMGKIVSSKESMGEQQRAFNLEEYKALHQELDSRIKESRLTESGAVAAIAGIYAWLATRGDASIAAFGWWIPVVFPVLGVLRYFALIRRMMEISEYIQSIEKAMCSEEPSGWETFLAKKRKSLLGILISFSSVCLWIVLLILTLSVAILFGT